MASGSGWPDAAIGNGVATQTPDAQSNSGNLFDWLAANGGGVWLGKLGASERRSGKNVGTGLHNALLDDFVRLVRAGERVRGLQWWVIGLGLAGLVLILEPQQMGGTVGSKLLAVLAGMSWAGGAVVTKRLRQRTEVDLFSLTTWQTIFAAVPLVAVVLLTPAEPIDWSTPFLIALVYNVIPGTAVAALLWMLVLDRLSAGTAGLGVLLNPTVGVLAAWLQLGERPSAIETAGMIVLAMALLLNAIQAMRSAQPS